ncbi:MAG: sulfotransferase [Cyanothece sp. SIO2G6]|nr:sulfotransferase [Cyanothece sp. SIO2G6]
MGKKVVFILGIGRSGTTLIDLMLGSHPQGFSLGEISKLPERTRKGKPIAENTTFWTDTFTEAEIKKLSLGFGHYRINPLVPLKIERFVRELINQDEIFNPYSLLFSKIQAEFLVDSSKYPYWVKKQTQAREFRSGSLTPFILWIVRDGRAVINSYRRVYPNWTFEQKVQRWQQVMLETQDFFQALPDSNKKQIRYEALASDPQAVLTDICRWLGIQFVPEMIEYWTHEHHYICGGQGTRALIDRYKGLLVAEGTRRVHGDYYNKADYAIQLDTRWKDELQSEDIEKFYTMTDGLNRAYEWNN